MAARANLSNRRIAACTLGAGRCGRLVRQSKGRLCTDGVVKHASCWAGKHCEDVSKAMRYPTWSSRPILGDTVRGTQGMVQPAVHTWGGAANIKRLRRELTPHRPNARCPTRSPT